MKKYVVRRIAIWHPVSLCNLISEKLKTIPQYMESTCERLWFFR